MDAVAKDAPKNAREKHTIDRIKTAILYMIDNLCDEFSNCKFEVKLMERRIGDSKDKSKPKDITAPEFLEFKLDGGEILKIGGFVDRIDTFRSGDKVYIRVIDYKTGSKDFSPKDLKEGHNLQMFLYLQALIKSKNPEFLKTIGATLDDKLIPAGVIYVKNDFGDSKIDHSDNTLSVKEFNKNQRRIGMILADKESVTAMNTNYLPVRYNKSATPTTGIYESIHSLDRGKLYTEEEFEQHIESARKSINDAIAKTKDGKIPAEPMKTKKTSPCEYCKYKPICRNVK